MKQKITLLDVCKLPDAQLHSKASFLKKHLNFDTNEINKMKQKIAKLSYTIKTVGIRQGQIGIASKRVPLKYKQAKQQQCVVDPENFQHIQKTNYLPHRAFYSSPLGTCRGKFKDQLKQNEFQVVGNKKSVNNQEYRITTGFRAKSYSTSRIRYTRNEQRETLRGTTREKINNFRKSYSKMIVEMDLETVKKPKLITPLRHEEHPLFKKLIKLNQLRKVQMELTQD